MTGDEIYAKKLELIQVDDEFNTENSQFAVVELRYFSKLFSSTTLSSYTNITSYTNFSSSTVVVEFIGTKNNVITDEQYQSYTNLIRNEEQIALAVRKEIYSYYESNRKAYLHGVSGMASESEITKWFPKIINGNELDNRIKLNSVLIYPAQDKVSKINLRFWWSIDDDDIGVIMRGDKIIAIGSDLDML